VDATDAFPPLRVPAPKEVTPSVNCTLPVAELGVTVPVNVTDCPKIEGFNEELSVTLVLILETVWGKAADVLAALVPSPLYAAVMECDPPAREGVVNVAVPPERFAVPKEAVPSKNWTLPVAEAGVTCAVNVTPCPTSEGLAEEARVTPAVNLATVCVSVAEVLAASVPSPL
jgi:hypothetical protein